MKRNRSHFKLNWQIYVASAFAGALAIWFIAYCREFYAFSNASIRPFAADVWGTVSDWAMVFVAGITGVFVLRTLQLQQEVNTLNNKLNSYIYRPKVIIPKGDIDEVDSTGYGFINIIGNHFTYSINIQNDGLGPITKIWACFENKKISFEGKYSHIIEHNKFGSLHLQLPNSIFETGKNSFRFFIHFLDLLSNEYTQEIRLTYEEDDDNYFKVIGIMRMGGPQNNCS